MRPFTFTLGLILLAACSSSSSTPPPNAPEPPSQDQPAETESGSPANQITAADCEGQGGKVIGDIGDGAVHRPDYRCEGSGEPPIGTIAAEPGGPVAVEGAVCCK
jgi:hypothetical protein